MPQETPTTSGSASGAGLSRAVRAVSGVTLLSRFGGLVREVLVSRVFGDTALGSAFAAAFQIPNLFRRLFGEGALSAAFIPAYAKAVESGEGNGVLGLGASEQQRGGELASLTLIVLGVVTWGLTVAAEVVLLLVLVLGTHSTEREMLLRLVMVMLPFMPVICTAAILAGMLQVHGRFGPASSGPLVLNGFIIAAAGYLLMTGQAAGEAVAYLLGVATVVSGVTQCVWFVRLLSPHVRWTREYRSSVPEARGMFRKFVPVAVGLGTLQLSTFIDTLICTYTLWAGPTLLGHTFPLGDTSNVIVTAAQRLYQFPLGVFGIAVATAVFPMLSRHAGAGGSGVPGAWEAFRNTLWRGVRLSLFIAVPASAGLLLVREELSYVLYAGGAGGAGGFSAAGVARVSNVLMGYSLGVWVYSLNHVLTRAFYARGDTRTPMLVSLGTIVVNLTLTMVLIWWVAEAGLAWSSTITAGVQLAALILLASRWKGQDARTGGASGILPLQSDPRRGVWNRDGGGGAIRSIVTTLGATAAMAGAVLVVRGVMPGSGGAATGGAGAAGVWTTQLLRLGAQTAAGGVAFFVMAALLRSNELRELLTRTRQR